MEIIKLSKNGYRINNIFSDELINELLETNKVFQADSTRRGDEGAQREVFYINGELLEKVRNAVFSLKAHGLAIGLHGAHELWRDYAGYNNQWHFDDPVNVKNIMIIYLDDMPARLGTQYTEDDEVYAVAAKKNTALLLMNADKVEHGMISRVPENVIRRTLYINWKNNV